MPDNVADLVDLALAVYTADRLVPRRAHGRHIGPQWPRHIRLSVPLRVPEFWRDDSLTRRLEELLWFLTTDVWEIDFARRIAPDARRATQQFLDLHFEQPNVLLFSGGLDSLAGACYLSHEKPARDIFLVSCSTNNRTKGIQRDLGIALKQRLQTAEEIQGRRIESGPMPFDALESSLSYDAQERTQRSRAFFSLALGAAAAHLVGSHILYVFENGVGAINLPITKAQLGAQSTRSVHPLTLHHMGALVSTVVGARFTIENPFLFSTKGQICTLLNESSLGGLVRDSVSCDRFPQRVAGFPQCGHCTSCLLRRVGLLAAGPADFDDQGYRIDPARPGPRPQRAELYPALAMARQVGRLHRLLSHQDPWQELCGEYPELLEVAALASARNGYRVLTEGALVSLFRRYCDEWADFWNRSAGLHGLRQLQAR
jgi:7-cyano-7-deazaguanine synthase in queuosine biosynthesis